MRPRDIDDKRTIADIKNQIYDKISAGGTLKPVHHLKSLFFGLAMAGLVGLIMTFTFFNEVFIAPFMSPASAVTTTPIIGEQTGDVGPDPKIIIPKINLEVPVVYDMDTVDETAVQKALEQGVVHYASTPNPGEQGNVVIVGHSSNNILNSGKYKFAFVLLKRLESEDVFFLQKEGVRYTYKVYKKEIVSPNDVSVLDTQDRANTVTLITCDPPGTSINRLIIVAEQISPDPAGNTASSAIEVNASSDTLPSNAPSLWSRIWPF
jgi:LPXTG-site transpeptidase (sortase) family protein